MKNLLYIIPFVLLLACNTDDDVQPIQNTSTPPLNQMCVQKTYYLLDGDSIVINESCDSPFNFRYQTDTNIIVTVTDSVYGSNINIPLEIGTFSTSVVNELYNLDGPSSVLSIPCNTRSITVTDVNTINKTITGYYSGIWDDRSRFDSVFSISGTFTEIAY